MEKGSTKQEILDVALNFFSVQGYESTSIAQIADAVGIRKASLYSHFESKQDILDTLVKNIDEGLKKNSMFAKANWEDPEFLRSIADINPDQLVAQTQGQLKYVLHDPILSKIRKMLVIEQFINPELAAIHTQHNYDDTMNYHIKLFSYLVKEGRVIDADPVIMAAQFVLPTSEWLALCDRYPEREAECMDMIDKHIRQFYRLYQKK